MVGIPAVRNRRLSYKTMCTSSWTMGLVFIFVQDTLVAEGRSHAAGIYVAPTGPFGVVSYIDKERISLPSSNLQDRISWFITPTPFVELMGEGQPTLLDAYSREVERFSYTLHRRPDARAVRIESCVISVAASGVLQRWWNHSKCCLAQS